MRVKNLEDEVQCPIEGCEEQPTARGLHMHIFHTDDPDGQGHYPRFSVPPDFDPDDIEVVGKREVTMDYPDSVELEDTEYLDTYTGKSYQGKRGLMIHLGQMEGKENIPEDVTDRHDADDFPIVETDENGNITKVHREPRGTVPPLEPYLPWNTDEERGYIKRQRVKDLIEDIRDTPTQVISADALEEQLLS